MSLFLFGLCTATSKQSGLTEVPAKSIAVLPFENLSGNPENAYFTDGIQEEILMRLAKIADLKVVSRTSTVRYKRSPGSANPNRRLGHGREFARMHTRQWRAGLFAVRDFRWIDRADEEVTGGN